MRLIDADALCGEFKRRAVSARNWKERAIMDKNEEAIIRAGATLAFLSEVKLTIDNAPTVDVIPNKEGYEMYNKGYASGYERGKEARPQGEWIDTGDMQEYWAEEYQCSICGAKDHWHNYCPNCGADMRGKESE